uniref:DNA damage-regulated autophagy modulator protein 1 n=1 Tax=Parasteatoda tepidariorum TaxID=114398 RepID=A0A2L2YLV4_PARTP
MTSIGTVHGIGANVLFLGGVIYAILQTFLTYKMSPTYNGLTICHIRLIVTCIAAISLIASILLFFPLSTRSHSLIE